MTTDEIERLYIKHAEDFRALLGNRVLAGYSARSRHVASEGRFKPISSRR